jgi:mxaD protein
MRPLCTLFLILVLAGWGAPAAAHGPTPKKVEETIEIAAPPAAVWDILKDFGAIAGWHPLVEASEGKGGNVAGGERTVTLKSGGVLTDSLDDYQDGAMTYGYRLAKENTDAFPVSFYSATLAVIPAGSGSKVDWVGRFYRADTSNFPPEDKNDDAAIAAMTNFLQEGLKGLKAKAEGK